MENIKQKMSEMNIALNTKTGQVYVGGIKPKNRVFKDEKGYYLVEGYGKFMGKKYPIKKHFTPSENEVLDAYMQDKYAKGGGVFDENRQMVLNNNKQIRHHTEELPRAVKGNKHIPAWVVSKVGRSASDLSDVTHFLEGEAGTKYGEGGSFPNKWAVVREQVKFAVVKIIGLDRAFKMLNKDFTISPYSLLEKAVYSDLLLVSEIDRNVWDSAVSEAESIDETYRDSGEGIGSSDMTYFTKTMLNDGGINAEFVNDRLQRVDAKGKVIQIKNELPTKTLFKRGGTTIEKEHEIETDIEDEDIIVVEFVYTVSKENDGIGSYEFHGSRGYDSGTDYIVVEDIEWDKSSHTDRENEVIQKYLDKNFSSLAEDMSESLDPQDFGKGGTTKSWNYEIGGL
ncbi:MAG: hypothetical protein WCI04_00130 [archaeon]